MRNIEAGCVPLPKYLGMPEPLCVTTTAVRFCSIYSADLKLCAFQDRRCALSSNSSIQTCSEWPICVLTKGNSNIGAQKCLLKR